MARKFVTEREMRFIDHISQELIQHVSVQTVFYYAISPDETVADDLYDEAVSKTWLPPVKITAQVRYNNPETKTLSFGTDKRFELEVFCHTQELIERNLKPIEGDFVEYGQIFYEITSVTQPKQVFGQTNKKILTRLACVSSREMQFQAGSNARESVDPSHPVDHSEHYPPPKGEP